MSKDAHVHTGVRARLSTRTHTHTYTSIYTHTNWNTHAPWFDFQTCGINCDLSIIYELVLIYCIFLGVSHTSSKSRFDPDLSRMMYVTYDTVKNGFLTEGYSKVVLAFFPSLVLTFLTCFSTLRRIGTIVVFDFRLLRHKKNTPKVYTILFGIFFCGGFPPWSWLKMFPHNGLWSFLSFLGGEHPTFWPLD